MLKHFKHGKIRGTISTSVPHSKFCGTPPYSRDLRPCVEEYAIITSLGKLAKQELKTREEKAKMYLYYKTVENRKSREKKTDKNRN